LGHPGSAPSEDLDARSRLLESALQRVGRGGVHGTSTRDIIAGAGLRNPSAITYYFGSKAELVDELIREVNLGQSAIIKKQAALARDGRVPTALDWAAVAVDSANGMLATERGCLLARVWAERDEMAPDSVEEFVASDHDLARAWRRAVTITFPDLPVLVAIARSVVVLRTVQWLTVRRARRLLDGAQPGWTVDPDATRPFVLELALNILTPPTAITDDELRDH
jgi:AcrR family transcriptional regulator